MNSQKVNAILAFGVFSIALFVLAPSVISAEENATISGRVIEDMNGDGDLADGVPIDGWQITLGKATEDDVGAIFQVDSTLSANGNYSFSVPAGTYLVCADKRSNWVQIFPTSGFDCGEGSFGHQITVAAGESTDVADFVRLHLGTIVAREYFDGNANGVKDFLDTPLENWPVRLLGPGASSSTFRTIFNGVASFTGVYPGAYTICEEKPLETNWHQVSPSLGNTCSNGTRGYSITVRSGTFFDASFGNYCLRKTEPKGLGYWTNRNGQSLLTAEDFEAINALTLRDGSGDDRNFLGSLIQNNKDFNSWALKANGKNMAYMLSAQRAISRLNFRHDRNALLGFYLPANLFIFQIVSETDAELFGHPLTLGQNVNRSRQELLKAWLDDINNGIDIIPLDPSLCSRTF